MSRRVVRAACLAAVVALVSAGAALADAGGQGTVTITTHRHNVVLFSAPATTCTGAPGTITATAANEVFHVTFFTVSDEFWFNIPGNLFIVMASDIANLNLRYIRRKPLSFQPSEEALDAVPSPEQDESVRLRAVCHHRARHRLR